MKIRNGFERGDRDRSAQCGLHHAAHTDGSERRFILPGRGLQVTADPAGGDGFFTGCAAFHVIRSEEHTSELQSRLHLVCRLLLEKKEVVILWRCELAQSPYA